MPEAQGLLGHRLERFPDPSGALVLYGAVERDRLPSGLGLHAQLEWDDPGSLFVSLSAEGDGRAPAGQATVIASVFTPARPWFGLQESAYQRRKQRALEGMQAGLRQLLGLAPADYRHVELATPRPLPLALHPQLVLQPDRQGHAVGATRCQHAACRGRPGGAVR
ncbi:MAG: hypothetical protein ACKOFN_09475, partial [Vulcanococcus sp.]